MAAALFVAMQPTESATAQSHVVYQVAQGSSQAEPLSFLVRFRGNGPIARAQALAAGGRIEPAQREIETQLRRQTAFAGLCFERFTLGAAEVVLRTCEPAPASERVAMQAQWLSRLRAMRAVTYADVNTTVALGRAG